MAFRDLQFTVFVWVVAACAHHHEEERPCCSLDGRRLVQLGVAARCWLPECPARCLLEVESPARGIREVLDGVGHEAFLGLHVRRLDALHGPTFELVCGVSSRTYSYKRDLGGLATASSAQAAVCVRGW